MDAGFSSKIILNDEAHFHFDGFVNRQNCHVSENVIKINAPTTCHCLMRILDRRSIIGLYFFENDADQAAMLMVFDIAT